MRNLFLRTDGEKSRKTTYKQYFAITKDVRTTFSYFWTSAGKKVQTLRTQCYVLTGGIKSIIRVLLILVHHSDRNIKKQVCLNSSAQFQDVRIKHVITFLCVQFWNKNGFTTRTKAECNLRMVTLYIVHHGLQKQFQVRKKSDRFNLVSFFIHRHNCACCLLCQLA